MSTFAFVEVKRPEASGERATLARQTSDEKNTTQCLKRNEFHKANRRLKESTVSIGDKDGPWVSDIPTSVIQQDGLLCRHISFGEHHKWL